MGDETFRVDDAAKERAQQMQANIMAHVARAYDSVLHVWASVGITIQEADERSRRFADCFKTTADNIKRAEKQMEKEAIEYNQHLGREVDELYKELGVDSEVNHANIQVDDTIIQLKEKLEKEFNRLIALKDEMLEGIRSLKQREDELCAELDMTPLLISGERVPTERDIRDMETQVKMLESEKTMRTRSLSEARAKILDLWALLGVTAEDAFEKDLRDQCLTLSKDNVNRAQRMVSTLEARVDELRESLDLRKNEIELLWSRLDYNSFHVEMFREKYFGIKPEQFAAMDAELSKLRREKSEKLGQFIENIRLEIRDLGEKLMYGPEAFEDLNQFMSDDQVSQELLDKLEGVANRMRMELESRATLLRKAQKWQALIADHHRVETESKDPNRLKNRGGGLLQLSKEAARLAKVIPDMFSKLRQEILDWEITNEKEFKVHDQRFTQTMESEFFGTSLGPKPRVPIGSISTGKRKQPPPASGPSILSCSKVMKRNDGTIVTPGSFASIPSNQAHETLESVPDFAAFRTGLDSASKAKNIRRRSPRLAGRLHNPGLKALADGGGSGPLRPGTILRPMPSPMANASRVPFNEITSSPVVNHLTSTQVESPSKRFQFPRRF